MRLILCIFLMVNVCAAVENNEWMVQHDDFMHITSGAIIGATAAWGAKELGAPDWVQYATAFLVPCAVGFAKESWYDQNYSGHDMSTWAIGGAGAVAVTAAFKIEW